MVLFFSVRRHQAAYFRKLSSVMRSPSRVIRHKHCLLPMLIWPPAESRERLREITALKVAEIAQARPSYSLHKFPRQFLYVMFLLFGFYRLLCYLRLLRRNKPTWLALWSGVMWNQALAVEAARQCQIRCIFFENGLLPNTATIDPAGVNYLNSVPREADFFRSQETTASVDAVNLIPRVPKLDKPRGKPIELPARYLFVPFQVDVDRQILMYSPWIKHMQHLYQVLLGMLEVLPEDMWIVFKEHPSSAKDYSFLSRECPARMVFANDNSTQVLIENAQAVVTINSTVGIEALLLGKPVITLGQAFYNIDGIVSHADTAAQLRSILGHVDTLSVDSDLVRRFIGYLKQVYVVAGSWKTADQDHLSAAAKRIEEIQVGSFPPVRAQA